MFQRVASWHRLMLLPVGSAGSAVPQESGEARRWNGRSGAASGSGDVQRQGSGGPYYARANRAFGDGAAADCYAATWPPHAGATADTGVGRARAGSPACGGADAGRLGVLCEVPGAARGRRRVLRTLWPGRLSLPRGRDSSWSLIMILSPPDRSISYLNNLELWRVEEPQESSKSRIVKRG